MNIYLLSGYAGSGKSFAATCLQRCIKDSRQVAFADPIKAAVSKKYNISRTLCDTQEGKAALVDENGTTVRDLLIQYAANAKIIYGNSVFADSVVDTIRKNSSILSWIVHDWRYLTEYTTLYSAFPNATIHRIRIVRTSVQSMPIPSEHELDTYEMDHSIYNDGTAAELTETLIDRLDLPQTDS